MNFEFATAARVVFGRAQLERLGELCRPLGRRILLVRGSSHLDHSAVLARLDKALEEFHVTPWVVEGEPDLTTVEGALNRARATESEVVVGIGGGSVLDTAKAVAGLVTHPGTTLDYLEVVGRGRPLVRSGLPLVALPTTAGTGTEVTKNAVISVKEQEFKASIRSEYLLARVALVDPSLTDALPKSLTASTGLDALTQLLEPFVSVRAQPLTDALALQGLALVARALRRAFATGEDPAARDDMALASLLGGVCLANAGLGAVHGFAAPLGASFPIPHGAACAALLPHVVRANLAALASRAPDSPALGRYAKAFSTLMGSVQNPEAVLDAGADWLAQLVTELEIPTLSHYGVEREHIPELVARARQASSMRGNPIALTEAELTVCLQAAL
jgi:alcohol dehydrogenase class IV